jgi:cytochrome c peroxidase
MLVKRLKLIIHLLSLTASGVMMFASSKGVKAQDEALAKDDPLTRELTAKLHELGFTGRIADKLENRLGRRIDHKLANLGRLLWFDTIGGLNNDNTCAGCYSPTNGFGDTQSIAIGIENNGIVGPHRTGPRNQRRTPFLTFLETTSLFAPRCCGGSMRLMSIESFSANLSLK